MYRARVAGHICLDLLPRLGTGIPKPGALAEAGPLEMRLGGCVANTGLALAGLGAPVELVAAIGDDPLGDTLATLLAARHRGLTSLRRVARRATSYSIVIEVPGEDRRFLHHVGANDCFDVTDASVHDTDLLHIGYPQLLPALVDNGGVRLSDLLGRARSADLTTSVDFATVDPASAHRRLWPEIVRQWAPLIDILSPSSDDLMPMFDDLPAEWKAQALSTADALAAKLLRAGVGIALVTAGRAGMCMRTAARERFHGGGRLMGSLPSDWTNRQLCAPAMVVEPVRTTGAGDTATAGLLYGLLGAFKPEDTLLLATTAAALHVSGTEVLPSWTQAAAHYSNPLVLSHDVARSGGWTADAHGILHGPDDGKEFV